MPKKGGLIGGIFAVFIPAEDTTTSDPRDDLLFTKEGYRVKYAKPLDYDYAQDFMDKIVPFISQLENKSKEKGSEIKIIRSYNDLLHAIENNIFAMLLHFEGAEAIHRDLSNLEYYYDQVGLRSLGLVWSRPNDFGYGVPFQFPSTPDTGPGLTKAGKALIQKCNELGIIVDLAHINQKGFFDAAKISKAPLIVTHTDVHSIAPTSRNLTDRQIDAIANSGGLIGINFDTPNIRTDGMLENKTPLKTIIDHINYIIERVGINHVAFGSDFDGAAMPNDLNCVSKLPNLVNLLFKEGYSDNEIEKTTYKNWLRVISVSSQ